MSQSRDRDRQQRRFVGRVRIFNEQRRQEFAQAGFPLVPEDQHMALEDYLDISRRRHLTSIPLFKLQLHMLEDLITAERLISQYKQKKQELVREPAAEQHESPGSAEPEEHKPADTEAKHELADAAVPEEDESAEVASEQHESLDGRADIRAINRELFFLKAEVTALRDIADGIAWRLFDYDRAVLHELARRSSKKHINPEGLQAELYALASFFNDRTGIAVLNDLTNFLKFGDVTVRHDSGEFEIVEVKASTTKSGRLTRQRQGLTELVSLLSSDQGLDIAGEPVKMSAVDVVPEMFVGNLRGLLERAAVHGASVEFIGSHLVVECMDFTSVRAKHLEKDRVFAVIDRSRSVLDKWAAAGDFVLPLEGHERYAHAQNYVPFSIFPLEPKICVRLMTGAIRVVAYLNVFAVLKEMEERGWTVVEGPNELAQSEDGPGAEVPIAVLKKGPLTTSIPAALLGRLAMEFLKPRSLAGLLDGVLADRREGGYRFVNFAGEHSMWR